MLAFLCISMGFLHAVHAECSLPVYSIPGVGTEQRCEHKAGCPKRTKHCVSVSSTAAFDPDSPLLSNAVSTWANCTVVCARNPDGDHELWKCNGHNMWERVKQLTALKCADPPPCPPFPAVTSGRCNALVVLGWVVDKNLDKCVRAQGCPLDAQRYAKGQLFENVKNCEKRLQVCQNQAQKNTVTGLSLNSPSINSSAGNSTSSPVTNTSSSNLTQIALAVLGAPIPTPAPVVASVNLRAQEAVVKSLAGAAVTSRAPLVQGPWGGAGVDVDVTMQELKKLNPTFTFAKNHEFEQYPLVTNDRFARLLYDDDNMLVRIVRE